MMAGERKPLKLSGESSVVQSINRRDESLRLPAEAGKNGRARVEGWPRMITAAASPTRGSPPSWNDFVLSARIKRHVKQFSPLGIEIADVVAQTVRPKPGGGGRRFRMMPGEGRITPCLFSSIGSCGW